MKVQLSTQERLVLLGALQSAGREAGDHPSWARAFTSLTMKLNPVSAEPTAMDRITVDGVQAVCARNNEEFNEIHYQPLGRRGEFLLAQPGQRVLLDPIVADELPNFQFIGSRLAGAAQV